MRAYVTANHTCSYRRWSVNPHRNNEGNGSKSSYEDVAGMAYLSTAPETPWARAPLPMTTHGPVLGVITFFLAIYAPIGTSPALRAGSPISSYIVLISPPYTPYTCLSIVCWFLCCVMANCCCIYIYIAAACTHANGGQNGRILISQNCDRR